MDSKEGEKPDVATAAVLVESAPVPEGTLQVKGLEFGDFKDKDITVSELLGNMGNMGFQASNLHTAMEVIDKMVRK